MPQELMIIVAPDGRTTSGVAEIWRYSTASRVIRATIFVIAGLIGGTVCIIVPIVHLITTWGFPLLGILMAVRTMRREVVIIQPECVCPHCNEQIQLQGGAINDPEWQVCTKCKTSLSIRLPEH